MFVEDGDLEKIHLEMESTIEDQIVHLVGSGRENTYMGLIAEKGLGRTWALPTV
jgi:hypothetical protein